MRLASKSDGKSRLARELGADCPLPHGRGSDCSRTTGERGFALLIVFLLAAAIALMLYQQMPRVAFESERDKEDLLIDRGEQYKRAIQLYMVVNKRYPSRIEDLENTNDKRFLRKRYIDPFTGKNEWRLVHTNGMFLTDSLVQKPPSADGKNPDGTNKDGSTSSSTSSTNTTGGTNSTTGTNPNGAAPPPDVNATVFQRPSDRTLPTGIPGQPGFPPPTNDPGQVGVGPRGVAFPPITLTPIQGNGQQPVNGQGLPPGMGQNNLPGQPTLPGGIPVQFPNPVTGQLPGQGMPGQGVTDPSQPQPVQPGQGFPGGGLPGLPGQGIPGQFPGGQGGPAGSTTAAGIITQLLTTPRNPPPGIGVPSNNNSVGGGIAGVASTFEGPSIKSYNTRTKFNEWEFVFQNQQQGVSTNAAPSNPPGGPSTGPSTTPATGTTTSP